MERYNEFMHKLYSGFVADYWMQLIGFVFMFFALWFSFKRRNFIAGTVCILISAGLAYGTGVAAVVRRLIHG